MTLLIQTATVALYQPAGQVPLAIPTPTTLISSTVSLAPHRSNTAEQPLFEPWTTATGSRDRGIDPLDGHAVHSLSDGRHASLKPAPPTARGPASHQPSIFKDPQRWSLVSIASTLLTSLSSLFISTSDNPRYPAIGDEVPFDLEPPLEDLDSQVWTERERIIRTIPQYVLDHAPLVHLYSGEHFWPCDIADHLQHVRPYINLQPMNDTSNTRYNLTNLNELNSYKGPMYLTSDDNVEDRPDWLGGESNIPSEPSDREPSDGDHDPIGGRSDAPATVIVVDKGHGIVDAFFHFFYCYNLGNKVFNVRWGNHVGDWEHMVVRFKHGEPKAVFFSEHNWGSSFTYEAVEKIGKRPVGYSATGTHAMYATPAVHRYVLPFGLLHDVTDRGPLWDPLQNMHSYIYNMTSRQMRATSLTPRSPTAWLYFRGRWGDKAYPMKDRRQYYFAGQYHYVSGPSGPMFKNLERKEVCIRGHNCSIKRSLADANRVRFWPGFWTDPEVEDL